MTDTPATLDLAALDTRRGAEEGFELALTHPRTGEPLPGRIRVLGQDAEAWQEKLRELLKARVDRLQRNRKHTATLEELEADAVEQLVAVTVGWTGLTLAGADFPFSPENARRLYTGYPWIREQVAEAVNDRGNFLPRSASN